MNENKNKTYQNLWMYVKKCLEGKFIAVNTYNKKEEKSPNSPSSTLRN